MVTIHTHTLPLERTIVSNAGRTVFIIHAFRTPILPDVAQEIVGAVRVILEQTQISSHKHLPPGWLYYRAGTPGVPGSGISWFGISNGNIRTEGQNY